MTRPDLRRRAAAEGLATFALVFAGCGAIVADAKYGGVLGVVGIAPILGASAGALAYQLVRGETARQPASG